MSRRRLDVECYDHTPEGASALYEAGVRTTRVGVYWNGLRPGGVWNSHYADDMTRKLDLFADRGIEPIVVLTGVPAGYSVESPEWIGEALAQDVHRLVADRRWDRFRYWELFNEPDVGFDPWTFGTPPDGRVHNPDDLPVPVPSPTWGLHRSRVGAVWNAIARRVVGKIPGLVLSGGVGQPETLAHLDTDLWDIASVHAYGTPEHILDVGRRARELTPPDRELWLTEHNTTPPDLPDVEQARAVTAFARAHERAPVYDRTLLYVWDRHRGTDVHGRPWYRLSPAAKEAVRAWNAGETPVEDPEPPEDRPGCLGRLRRLLPGSGR